MKTLEKEHYDFGGRSLYQIHFDTSKEDNRFRVYENQQFIVPWQMSETKKKEVLIE